MTHHGNEQEHEPGSESGPVIHGGEGDPLGEGVEEAADEGSPDGNKPPLPDDEPKPGL